MDQEAAHTVHCRYDPIIVHLAQSLVEEHVFRQTPFNIPAYLSATQGRQFAQGVKGILHHFTALRQRRIKLVNYQLLDILKLVHAQLGTLFHEHVSDRGNQPPFLLMLMAEKTPERRSCAQERRRNTKILRCRIFDTMGFVKDNPLVVGQDRLGGKVPRLLLDGDIGKEHVVIHHQNIGLRHLTPRLTHKTPFVIRTPPTTATVRLRTDPLPHFTTRHEGQIRLTPVLRFFRPRADGTDLLSGILVVQQTRFRECPIQFTEAEVVPPPFDQTRLQGLINSLTDEGNIFLDDLFLEVDSPRGHDYPFLIPLGPERGGQEIGKSLPHPRRGLHHRHFVLIEGLGRRLHQRDLLGTHFIARQGAADDAIRRKHAPQLLAVQQGRFFRQKGLHHDVNPGHFVVNDIDAMAVGAVHGRQLDIGLAGRQFARGVVMNHHIPHV